jgi:hypothetical protein
MPYAVVFTSGAEAQLTELYGVDADHVTVIGIFYGGQDYEAALPADEAD